ncbi:MAG TPA: transglutaminase-like domain-containing protein, partial [Alphaproteobacteria bacterium]|nr:transglutaminase-like domain-containing protein [Alphaproteobacteria bacterium]
MIPDDPIDDLHVFETPDEAFQYVRYAGTLADAEIDLAETALALALLFLPGLKPDRFRQHLRRMAEQLVDEHQQQLRQQKPDSLATKIAALKKVLHETNDYHGDRERYDDIQNANLIRVIERRQGLPVALGLLYVILARRAGWAADGLNFPGHFLVRLEEEGERMILDPFQDGQEMDAAALRQLLKSIIGEKAELSHQFYLPVSNRDMLIR